MKITKMRLKEFRL